MDDDVSAADHGRVTSHEGTRGEGRRALRPAVANSRYVGWVVGGSWSQDVLQAVLELRRRLDYLPVTEPGADPTLNEISLLISAAEDLAVRRTPSLWKRIPEWWTGNRLEACWRYLHEADIRLTGLSTQGVAYEMTRAHVDAHAARLGADDPWARRLALATAMAPAEERPR